MKERVKVAISKEMYEKIQHVNFSDVVVSLKAIRCELNLDDKTEKDHCAILDIEPLQKDNQMNIDKLEIQTPEEKESLDSIKPVHLRDYQEKTFPASSEGVSEWSNGDDVEAYGKPYKYVGIGPFNDNLCICLANPDDDPQCFSVDVLKKPETPEAKENRERLEAAFDLYLIDSENSGYESFNYNQFCKDDYMRNFWLAIVDKTNYRKGVK